MCVIMIAGKTRPTDEMIKRAWDTNKDGGGAAWRELDADGKPEVVWKKGIQDVEDMLQLLHSIPPPFVAHFRIATVGGNKPTLTHPFFIGKDASTELEGRTKDAVLFHNGHWTDWNDKALDAAIASNNKVPTGDWSDTRAMAWMTHIYGPAFMKLLTQQKGVIWTPTDLSIFTGKDGWEQINNVWCSNNNFWTRSRQVYGNTKARQVCAAVNCACEVYDNTQTLCYPCRQKAKTSQEITLDDPAEEHSSAGVSNIEKAAVEPPTALVAVTGRYHPFVKFLTLPQAEELHVRGGLSKSALQKYRKSYQRLGAGGRSEQKAILRLAQISNRVGKALLHGSVH